jgi:uncharacterized phage-associated protein
VITFYRFGNWCDRTRMEIPGPYPSKNWPKSIDLSTNNFSNHCFVSCFLIIFVLFCKVKLMISYQFNKNKAVNALLFISRRIADDKGRADKYAILKILYFAEKKHLVEYGRLITDDKFAALKFGPVPSNSYDLLDYNSEYFAAIDNKSVNPLTEPNLQVLSKSDIDCLERSISENKNLGFNELKAKSHDKAYHNAFDNSIQWMSIEAIAEQEGADKDILGYIKEHYEILNYAQCVRA